MKALIKAGSFPQVPFDVTPDLMVKLEKVLSMVKNSKRVEITTEKHFIKAWTYDPGNGSTAVGISIVEAR